MPKYIELTRGYRTIVDDEDFAELSRHKWFTVIHNKKPGLVYAARQVPAVARRQRTVSMHRQIMGVVDAGYHVKVDHKNGDGLDNQRCNLRVVTHKINLENRRGLDSNNTSGYRGVSWCRRTARWAVYIGHGGRHIFGGYFDDIEEANRAAIALRQSHFTLSDVAAHNDGHARWR